MYKLGRILLIVSIVLVPWNIFFALGLISMSGFTSNGTDDALGLFVLVLTILCAGGIIGSWDNLKKQKTQGLTISTKYPLLVFILLALPTVTLVSFSLFYKITEPQRKLRQLEWEQTHCEITPEQSFGKHMMHYRCDDGQNFLRG